MGIHDPFDSAHAAVGPGGTLVAGTPFPPSPAAPSDAGQTMIGTGDPAQPFVTPVELIAQARKAGEEALCAMLQEAISPPRPVGTNALCGQVSLSDIPPWWLEAETHAETHGSELSAPWRSGITILMKLQPAEREVALSRIIELMNILSGSPCVIVQITRELTTAGY